MDIANLQVYTERMRKTLLDKVFFIDKIDAQVFVDFGCADGTVLGFIQKIFPENTYIGYDINSEMVKSAQSTYPDITFTSNIKDVYMLLESRGNKKSCLILSSVIHEIYSYSSLEQIKEFYSFMYSGSFDYIVVRDMMPNISINRESEINDRVKLWSKANWEQLHEFEQNFGSITSNRNLVHYLLKYSYIENWKREVKENYFPITTQEFLSKIPTEYTVDYYNEFLLPYTKQKVLEDFGIVLKDTTHVKLILRKL